MKPTTLSIITDYKPIDLDKFFPGLTFDPVPHKYTVDGVQYPSVSGLIDNFYTKFDTEEQSLKYSEARGFTQEQVKLAWEGVSNRALDLGSSVHDFGEEYGNYIYFNIGKEPKVFCKQTLGIVDFFNNLPTNFEVLAFEQKMYSRKYQYCGTADILLFNKNTGKVWILDYKTNKSIYSDSPVEFQKPLFHINKSKGLIQDNFGKYSLQLSFYQLMLEEVGINVEKRIIIWLEEDKKNKKLYIPISTPDLTEDILNWFKTK